MWIEIWIRTSPSPLNSASPESERARPEYDTSMVVPRICCSFHVSRQGAECLRRGYKRPNSPSAILVEKSKTSARSAASNGNEHEYPSSEKTHTSESLKTQSGESMNWR